MSAIRWHFAFGQQNGKWWALSMGSEEACITNTPPLQVLQEEGIHHGKEEWFNSYIGQ
jgi:hypothetical protein